MKGNEKQQNATKSIEMQCFGELSGPPESPESLYMQRLGAFWPPKPPLKAQLLLYVPRNIQSLPFLTYPKTIETSQELPGSPETSQELPGTPGTPKNSQKPQALSGTLSVCLSIYLSVCLSVCRSVYRRTGVPFGAFGVILGSWSRLGS